MKKLIFNNHISGEFIYSMARWHFMYYLKGKGTPISAGVYLTNNCNCRCIMCNIWQNKDIEIFPIKAQEKSIDTLSKVRCYYYSISGGEPTLVKDLPYRLEYASQKIPYVHFVTNGLTMKKELAQAIGKSGVSEISISIDGEKKFHDYIRGIKGGYEKAMNAVDLIKTYAPNVTVVINSVLTPYNINSVKTLSGNLLKIDGVSHKLLPMSVHELFLTSAQPIFENANMNPCSLREIEEFLDDAIKSRLIVNSPAFLRKAKMYFKNSSINLLPEQKYCTYPYHAIEFDSKGTAYPCITGMNSMNGLTADGNLKQYLDSDEYSVWQDKLRKCDKCKGSMMLCYYEPRLNFPINNLLRYQIS